MIEEKKQNQSCNNNENLGFGFAMGGNKQIQVKDQQKLKQFNDLFEQNSQESETKKSQENQQNQMEIEDNQEKQKDFGFVGFKKGTGKEKVQVKTQVAANPGYRNFMKAFEIDNEDEEDNQENKDTKNKNKMLKKNEIEVIQEDSQEYLNQTIDNKRKPLIQNHEIKQVQENKKLEANKKIVQLKDNVIQNTKITKQEKPGNFINNYQKNKVTQAQVQKPKRERPKPFKKVKVLGNKTDLNKENKQKNNKNEFQFTQNLNLTQDYDNDYQNSTTGYMTSETNIDSGKTTPVSQFGSGYKQVNVNSSGKKTLKSKFSVPKSGKKSIQSNQSDGSECRFGNVKRNLYQLQEMNNDKQKKVKKVQNVNQQYLEMFKDNLILQIQNFKNEQKIKNMQPLLEQEKEEEINSQQAYKIENISLKDIKIIQKNINNSKVYDEKPLIFEECLDFSLVCQICTQKLLSTQQNSQSQQIEEIDVTEVSKNIIIKKIGCICKGNLKVGWENYYNILVEKDKNLTEDWVKRNYQQVVWKLRSFDYNVKQKLLGKNCSIQNIYNELEYRVIKEFGKNQISLIKQIMEGDEKMNKHMVLVINRIWDEQYFNSYIILELSDGHYPIYLPLLSKKSTTKDVFSNGYYQSNNQMLLDLYNEKKLKPGMKLHVKDFQTIGLGNIDEAIKIHQFFKLPKILIFQADYNSISRAKHYEKLGKQQKPYFIKSLASLRPNGGCVPMIDVFITKKFPLLQSMYKRSKQRKLYVQMEEDQPQTETRFLNFRIAVQDALIYYDKQYYEKNQDIYTEIELLNMNEDIYSQIKVGDRVQFFYLKSYVHPDQIRNRLDFENKQLQSKILYLETQDCTKIRFSNDFLRKESSEEIQKIKNFGQQLCEINEHVSFTEIEENRAQILDIVKFDFIKNKIYCDLVIYHVKNEGSHLYGITANMAVICIKIHNLEHFGKKLHSLKPQKIQQIKSKKPTPVEDDNLKEQTNQAEGKIVVLYNLKIENFSESSAQNYIFNNAYLLTTDNSTVSINKSKVQKYEELISDLEVMKDSYNEKFEALRQHIIQNI